MDYNKSLSLLLRLLRELLRDRRQRLGKTLIKNTKIRTQCCSQDLAYCPFLGGEEGVRETFCEERELVNGL